MDGGGCSEGAVRGGGGGRGYSEGVVREVGGGVESLRSEGSQTDRMHDLVCVCV